MNTQEYTPDRFESCLEVFQTNVPEFFRTDEFDEYSSFLRALPGPYLVLLDETGRVVGCGGYAVPDGSAAAELYETSKEYTGSCGAYPGGWTCRTYRYVDDQIAKGPFWKASLGVLVSITHNKSLVVAFQREGSKSNRGFELNADRLVIGWRSGTGR